MTADDEIAQPTQSGVAPELATRLRTEAFRPRFTIGRIMGFIAIVGGLLALSRYPFAFGLVIPVGLIALFVVDSIRRRCYGRVAWLIILYPAVPLLTLYLQWGLSKRQLANRGTPLFGGLIGLSDMIGFLCILAYVGCVSLVAGAAAERVRQSPTLKRAAWQVVRIMPVSWLALFVFAMWDPFGMLGYFFR